MAHNEQRAGSDDCYLGVDWNYTAATTTLKIAPTVWRWDRYNTANTGGRWWESLYPEPDGHTGGWTGLSWGTGSGWRQIDSFATRTYNRTKETQTIHLDVGTDSSFGTYNNGFNYIGELTRSWTLNIDPLPSYSVTYNNNGGGTAPAAQTKWYNEGLALRGAITNRTNYVFKNWNTKSDGTGTAYAAGAKYTGNAALTLYAQWYAPYTVSFNANSGSGAPGQQTKVYNTTLKLSTTKPTRTGYTFKGWATTQARANAGTVDYSSGANYTANASATLYAVWQINTWSVTYDGNGATGGSTASQTKTYGQTLTLRSNDFTKTNHNFVKWNTAANGSGTSYNAGASYTGNAALKLYAQWEIAHGSPSISSLTVKRCTSDGTESVEGDRMKVEAQWSVDNTTEGFEDTVGATFKVTLGNTTDVVDLSGTSGTVSFVHSATAAIGSSYKVTSVLADSKGFETTRTSTLSVAYFTMHFKVGGTGVGIGKPSTEDNLLDVGMAARFNALATAQGTTSSSVEFGSTNPRFRFSNSNASQNGELVFTDYDAIHAGATLAWVTDQPNSWFHTQNIHLNGTLELSGTGIHNPSNIEFKPSSSTANNGGYIDFHYNQSTADYTSRIIESASGVITIQAGAAYQFRSAGIMTPSFSGVSYVTGNQGAAALYVRKNTGSVWYPAVTLDTTSGGSWSIGNYNNENLQFSWCSKANRDSSTNSTNVINLSNTAGTLWSGKLLYDNNTGTSGTVTLSETAANFTWMLIGYRTEENDFSGLFVRSPNGKTVTLSLANANHSTSKWQHIKSQRRTINAKSITVVNSRQTDLGVNTTNTTDTNNIFVTHVIGFS